MAQQMHSPTDTGYRTEHRRDGNPLMRMILPFVVGLVLGWGIGEMTDNANNEVGGSPTGVTAPGGTEGDSITGAPGTPQSGLGAGGAGGGGLGAGGLGGTGTGAGTMPGGTTPTTP